MCESLEGTKIWTCGDHTKGVLDFRPCPKMNEPGHTVKVVNLGSSKQKTKCGQFNCRNP